MTHVYHIHVDGIVEPGVTHCLQFNDLAESAFVLLGLPRGKSQIVRVDHVLIIDGEIVSVKKLSIEKIWRRLREWIH